MGGGGASPSLSPSVSPSSRSKHWRSPDDAGESSKRRKHHHHHHRRHRRHSKHSRERDEGEGVPPVAVEASLKPPTQEDDEREEGEILEEEEDYGGVGAGVEAAMGGSDIESGEIKPDAADPVTSLQEDTRRTDLEAFSVDQNNLQNGSFMENAEQIKCSGNDALLKGRENKRSYLVKEEWNGEAGKKSGSFNDEEHEIASHREARDGYSDRDPEGTEKDKKYREAGMSDLSSRARSRSPVSGESSHSMKHKKRDERDGGALDSDSERRALKRHRESDEKGRSISAELLRDRYSESRRLGEHHRERSKSHDRGERSYERNVRNDLDLCEGLRHDRTDRYSSRSRASDKEDRKERERSTSYRRHDSREDMHGSRERNRERDGYSGRIKDRDSVEIGKEAHRERERSRSYSRHDIREDRHASRDRDRERGRYSSSIRDRDREDCRERDMSRERERERGRERERERERGRERERERERGRDANRGRERDRGGYGRDRNHGRDKEIHIEKERGGHRDHRHSSYDDVEKHKERMKDKESAKEAILTRHDLEDGNKIRQKDEEDYQEKIEKQLAKQDEEDVDKIKEESRKRRQAILEKYKQLQSQQHAESPSNVQENDEKQSADDVKAQNLNDNAMVSKAVSGGPENRTCASDDSVADPSFTLGKSPTQNGAEDLEKTAGGGGLGEGTPKSERSTDMFCDDIFGESPAAVRKSGKGDGFQIERSGLHDNWDDAEGYYSYRFGEVLDGRYEVIAAHGKGVFSTVVRAKDLKAGRGDPEEVAIKIIRNNETMYKAGLEELIILKKLAGADPEDKRHCVRFLSSFKYRNHLCLVFESLHMNLREVLKKFGRNIGLKLTAVRAYAKQLFIALKHLRNCGVLHCDIKPDNMLVNEAKNVLKLCDFGNAMFAGKNEITPYLVSRFYRAPEIILGLLYDHPMDIWSVGCCLYELYSGKVLFPGPSNNDMLRLHMELKGPFPKKMLRKGAFTDQHFDQDLNFHATEEDPVTKKTVKRLLLNIKPKDIGTLISGSPGEDPKMLANFKDLLERIFVLDPEKRMTVSQALSHPFITGK